MDAFSLTFFPSSSPFFLSSKPYLPPLLSRLPSSQSRSHPFFKNLPRVSTSDSPSAVVPVEDPIATGDISGEKFDWYSHWYPVAPVCDLDKRAPRAVTVLGLDLVVWWDREEGQWRVFEDRCPHRLAPLSEGRIDPWGRLQCVYHGWCFDGHGNCKLIPQAPADGPAVNTSTKACVSSYPCCVQNNIVWFWPKNEDQCKDILMKYKPPSMSELDDPSYTCTMGMRDIPYGYDVLIENLMDPAHVPYAHHKIMRIRKGSPLLTRDREGGVPVEITIEKLDINGFLAKNQFGYGEFVAPCLYHASPVSFSNNQKRRILLIFYCVPVNPGKSRLIWVFPRNFSIWIDQIVPRWMFHVGENLILDSDLYLLHIEERKIADAGSSNWQKTCFVPTKSDAMVITFRRWLKKYSNNLIDWANKVGTHLSPTPPREQLMDRSSFYTESSPRGESILKPPTTLLTPSPTFERTAHNLSDLHFPTMKFQLPATSRRNKKAEADLQPPLLSHCIQSLLQLTSTVRHSLARNQETPTMQHLFCKGLCGASLTTIVQTWCLFGYDSSRASVFFVEWTCGLLKQEQRISLIGSSPIELKFFVKSFFLMVFSLLLCFPSRTAPEL